MKSNESLVGKRFGRLVVESFSCSRNQSRWWMCRCDCGNKCEVQTRLLNNGSTKSCGCLQKERTSQTKLEDLTGKVFNDIYVVSISDKKSGRVHWNCICHCGNQFIASAKNLKSGNTKSCGCTRYNKTHDRFTDLTGKIYNNLLVKKFIEKDGHKYIWQCECLLCGKICNVESINIKNGHTTSCGCRISKKEFEIAQILDQYNIRYQQQKKFIGCKNKKHLRFDFYLPDYGIAVEYDGEFHYNGVENSGNNLSYQQNNDAIKTQYCEDNDIVLLRIPYWDKDNIEAILSDWLFLNGEENANFSDVCLSS